MSRFWSLSERTPEQLLGDLYEWRGEASSTRKKLAIRFGADSLNDARVNWSTLTEFVGATAIEEVTTTIIAWWEGRNGDTPPEGTSALKFLQGVRDIFTKDIVRDCSRNMSRSTSVLSNLMEDEVRAVKADLVDKMRKL